MKKNVKLLKKVESNLERLESADLLTDMNKNRLEDLKNLTKHNSDNCLVLEEINNTLLEFYNDLKETHYKIFTNQKTESIDLVMDELLKKVESKLERLESMDLVTDMNKCRLNYLKYLTKENSDDYINLKSINLLLSGFIKELEEPYKLKHTNTNKLEKISLFKKLKKIF